jgi:alpha-mannosidase
VEVEVEMPTSLPDGISVLDSTGRVLPSKLLSKDTLTNKYRLMVQINNVPSLGYEVVHAVPGARPFPTDITVRDLTLDNAALRVTVDSRTGCITSLYDKKANYETLAPAACGNQLQVFTDTPKTDDAWNIDPGTLDHVTPLTRTDSVQLVEKGPLRGVIRVSRTWQNSKFVQDIELYAGSDQVNIVNDIDWHETHVLLKVAFPLAASSKMATYEIPFGTIDRPTTRNNSWEEAKFEVPALRWADLGNGQRGFSLINESKYGYDCKDNVLRLTLLRSPVSPDPDADRGHHHFTYALFPHAGDWKTALTIRRGYEYNYKLAALQVEAHSGTLPLEQSFIAVKSDNVVLTAVKKAEDANGLILHFYEWAGKGGNVQFTLPKGAASATLTDLMEKPEGSALNLKDAQLLTVPVQPYSIVSVRIDYPITPK